MQASSLKAKLEKIGIMKNLHTIVSIDAIGMYPSISLRMVIKAITYFSEKVNEEDKGKISECLKLIKFGMGNTILAFLDKYYEYGAQDDIM